MNSVANSFCLLVILCFALHTNCASNSKGFTAFFGSDKLFMVNSQLPGAVEEMRNFTSKITALARHRTHLFVAIEKANYIASDFTILFVCYTKDFIRSRSRPVICENFDEPKGYGESMLSMVVVNNDLFVGASNGRMWRCTANQTYSCLQFNDFSREGRLSLKITGLDYNSDDGKIYATCSSGALLRCSTDKSDSCKQIYEDKKELTAVKIAYGAIWVGEEKGKLLKCPLNPKEIQEKIKCVKVDSSPTEENFHSIGAANDKLYVSLKKNELWECDPYVTGKLCTKVFDSPPDAEAFIIY